MIVGGSCADLVVSVASDFLLWIGPSARNVRAAVIASVNVAERDRSS